MGMYGDIAPGTWVVFNADSRLRKISINGTRDQAGLNDGILIGEGKRAVVTQRVAPDAFVVFFPELNCVGWTYSYEFALDELAPKLPLKFEKMPKNG